MSESSKLTRREFVIVGAAAVSAPFLGNLPVLVPAAEAVEALAPDPKDETAFDSSRCNGCQMCTIFFSVCPAVHNRVCWCEQQKP